MIREAGSAVSATQKTGHAPGGFFMGCLCNLFDNDTFVWILIIILLLVILGN